MISCSTNYFNFMVSSSSFLELFYLLFIEIYPLIYLGFYTVLSVVSVDCYLVVSSTNLSDANIAFVISVNERALFWFCEITCPKVLGIIILSIVVLVVAAGNL